MNSFTNILSKDQISIELDSDKAFSNAKSLHSYLSLSVSVGNTPNWIRVANVFVNITLY